MKEYFFSFLKMKIQSTELMKCIILESCQENPQIELLMNNIDFYLFV